MEKIYKYIHSKNFATAKHTDTITALLSKILATPLTRGLKLEFQSKSSGNNSPEWQFQWVGKGVSWLPSPIEA